MGFENIFESYSRGKVFEFYFLPFFLLTFEVTRVYQGLLRVVKGYQGLIQVNSDYR